ncbi:hypothetical protein GS438_01240 [Rhodococcus hoagii]|nr:hypothetical protein [Prescottella equi]
MTVAPEAGAICSIDTSPPSGATLIRVIVSCGRGASFLRWNRPSSPRRYTCSKNE